MKGRILERRAKEHRAIEKSREARRRKLSDYPPFSVTHPLELTRKRKGERGRRKAFKRNGGIKIWSNLAVRGISRLGKIKFPPPVDNAPVSVRRGGSKKGNARRVDGISWNNRECERKILFSIEFIFEFNSRVDFSKRGTIYLR